MRRLAAILVPLTLVVACGEAPPAGPPLDSVRAAFPPGGLADVIQVQTIDRLALRSAELVGPDGGVAPASSIDVDHNPHFAGGQYVANDPWRGSLGGNPGPALLGMLDPQANAAIRSTEQVLTTVSLGAIPLPDPVAYRRAWREYRIRLSFGVPPGEVRTVEIAAPEPPPR